MDKKVEKMNKFGADVKHMEEVLEETKRDNERAQAARTKDLNEMKFMHADIVAVQEKRDADEKQIEKEIAHIERMANVVSEAKKLAV